MGGGAMRTAAKAAALGGYRAATNPFADQAAANARRASRPPTSTISTATSSGEGGPSVSPLLFQNERSDVPVVSTIQRPSWEIDGWEFAGGKEEEIFDSLRPAPRLVFGPVPTLDEAKEATSDLKDALEKAYFSSTTTEDSKMGVKGSSLLGPKYLGNMATKASVTGESAAIFTSVPSHVIQAFSLLQGSTEAQNVVASLASDKNVWDAVMKNEKVMEFYKTHESILPPESIVAADLDPEESTVANVYGKEPSESSEACSMEESSESLGNGFMDFVHDIKLKVSKMVNNLSDFFQDFIIPSTEGRSSMGTKTSTAESNVDVGIGASFIALAIAAIMVILLKRG